MACNLEKTTLWNTTPRDVYSTAGERLYSYDICKLNGVVLCLFYIHVIWKYYRNKTTPLYYSREEPITQNEKTTALLIMSNVIQNN